MKFISLLWSGRYRRQRTRSAVLRKRIADYTVRALWIKDER